MAEWQMVRPRRGVETVTSKRVSIYFAPYDFWIGVFFSREHPRTLYICPLPMLVIRVRLEAGEWEVPRENADLRRQLEDARHDILAYCVALGYPVPGDHNGLLTDGIQPKCGLCDAKENQLAAASIREAGLRDAAKAVIAVDDFATGTMLPEVFAAAFQKAARLCASVLNAADDGVVKRVREYMMHKDYCNINDEAVPRTCTCGLDALRRELGET